MEGQIDGWKDRIEGYLDKGINALIGAWIDE